MSPTPYRATFNPEYSKSVKLHFSKVIATLFALIAPSIAFAATNVPPELPLTRERLRAYALDHVNHVTVAVSGTSVSGTTWAGTDYSPDGDPDKIAAAVAKLQLSYTVLPNEKLMNMVSWDIKTDTFIYSAFFGGKQFTLVPGKGGDVVPNDAMKVDMILVGMPISLPGVSASWFNYRNSYGDVVGQRSLNQEGRVFDGSAIILTTDMLSPGAELNILFADGTRAIYSNGGQLLALDTISTSGISAADPRIRVSAENSTTIVCTESDEVVRVHYTRNVGTVNVSAASVLGILPDTITAVEKTAFDADPNGTGITWVRDKEGPPLSFTPKVGETWLILVHIEPPQKGG